MVTVALVNAPDDQSIDKKSWAYRCRNDLSSFISTAYSNIKTRIKRISSYKGLRLLSREDFNNWCLNDKQNNQILEALFNAWIQSGRQNKLAPSVNRKNPKKGYTLDNIEWITHGENSRRARIKK